MLLFEYLKVWKGENYVMYLGEVIEELIILRF